MGKNRWQVELFLRNIKTTLGMEVLQSDFCRPEPLFHSVVVDVHVTEADLRVAHPDGSSHERENVDPSRTLG